jgi:hypothetical protein
MPFGSFAAGETGGKTVTSRPAVPRERRRPLAVVKCTNTLDLCLKAAFTNSYFQVLRKSSTPGATKRSEGLPIKAVASRPAPTAAMSSGSERKEVHGNEQNLPSRETAKEAAASRA